METCPNCGSENIVEIEIDLEDDSNSLMECEDCNEQFTRDEM